MDSPISGVLETYELLENILLAVPMQQLFVLRRVSKTWKAMIQRSENLRKKMFLIADGSPLRPKPSDTPWDVEYAHHLQLNPAIPTFCGGENHDYAYKDESDSDSDQSPVLGEFDVRKFSDSAGPTFAFFYAPTKYSLQQRFPRGEWRRLLLTQPPVTALQLNTLRLRNGTLRRANEACVIYNPNGVRLRDLHGFHEKLCKSSKDFSSMQLTDIVFEFVLLPEAQEKVEGSSKDEGEGSEAKNEGCVCDVISEVLAENSEEEEEEEEEEEGL